MPGSRSNKTQKTRFTNISRNSQKTSVRGSRVTRKSYTKSVGSREATVFKASLSDMWEKLRARRRDAYIHYVRNAKFLLRIGHASIPHYRMYHTLKLEHELYSDFCNKYMDLGRLKQLFADGSWMTEKQLRLQEQQFAKTMAQHQQQYNNEIETLKRRHALEIEYAQEFERLNAQKIYQRMLEHQLEELKTKLDNKSRIRESKQYRETETMQNTIHQMETQLRKMADENIELQQQIVELGAEKERVVREMELRDETVERLQKMMEELEERIRGLYVYEMAQAGWEFVSGVFQQSYEYLKEMGRKADEEIKQAKQEKREKRRLAKEEAERILREMQAEAERLAKELNAEKERAKKEEEERAKKAEEEREEMEKARHQKEEDDAKAKAQEEDEAEHFVPPRHDEEAKAKAEAEQEKKEREDDARARLNIKKDEAFLLKQYKDVLKLEKDLKRPVEKCPALDAEMMVLPKCKSAETRKRLIKTFISLHPDKNAGCTKYAEEKTKYYSGMKEYHDKLAPCK